jgi:hypothetical protein
MPEKIGKYEVIERIGRGGMGMIFKAHDPVLDRPVALKVISSEIEVTDELRARFFREAQACAKLSHPNIVTVYDMGEHDGRLFIVMELLEGEELRRLITDRRALPIEDKLSVMLQVCDGLHYAHRKGIVHRDIKPGNIFLLRNGQVKILDFGIAHIATSEGLTRTGLIMGTLRYISPEQVRGRSDHRSDIFSIGAVFYEFLTFRPPFTGEDPMHLLEQLRTEEPPVLTELDPTIPPELAAIVQRAMRKDPAERFPDLEQMRTQIEALQHGLSEEAQRIRARARSQRDQVVQLQAALAERLGAPGQEELTPPIAERGGVVTMQALEGDFAGRVEALREKIARTDALAPAFQRGTELLRAGQFSDAALEFEAIIVDMPEHARAQEGLRQARAQAEEQRRRQLAAELLRDARAAFDDGGFALCLEILKQAAEIPPPPAMVQDVASLRQTAEAALEAQEAARRGRQLAEQGREQMAQARRDAQGQDASRYAHGLWSGAEAKAAEAQGHFVQEVYAEASQAFELAATAYRQAQEAAREGRIHERESAERAREQMTQSHQQAQAADAAQYARELWDTADAKSAEAQTAFGRRALAHAIRAFDEASLLYGQAAEAARDARQRERQRAEEARGQATESKQSASVAGAERQATSLWKQASAKLAEAEAALERELYANAIQGFDGAVALYRQAESEAGGARRRQRAEAERGRRSMEEARRSALAVDAASHAETNWNEAEASGAAAEAAFTTEAYAEAGQSFEHASALYRRAEETAREATRRREMEQADAEKAREAASLASRAAVAAHVSKYVAEQWNAAEAAQARASDALSRQEFAAARSLFTEARRLYAAAVQAAGVAAEAEARRADAMMGTARRFLESGDAVACLRRLDEVLALRPGHKAAEALRLRAEEKLHQTDTAVLPAEAAPHDVAETLHAQPPDGLGETILQPPTKLAEPPTVLADQRTGSLGVPEVESRGESREAPVVGGGAVPDDATVLAGTDREDATVLAGATAYVDAARLSSAEPRVGDIAPSRGSTPAPSVPGRATPRPWRLLRKVAFALGGLSAATMAIFYVLPRSSPPVSPPAQQAAPTPKTVAPPIPVARPAERPVAPAVFPPARPATPAPTAVAPPAARLAEPPAGRGAAEELRKRVIAAREEAAKADAGRLAPTQFNAAVAKAREGEAALGQQDIATAQQRYREALEGYGLAKAEATRMAALARRDAELAASRSAAATAAEQTRLAVAKAQQDAEQVAAARQAEAARVAAAEQVRVAALQRQRAEAEVASLKSGVEQVRSRVAARREQAVKAEADRLAKDLFDVAHAKQIEADGLLSRQNFAAASQAYQDAQERYMEATLRAQVVREARAQADSARKRMLAEKQRAKQDSMEFRAATVEERQGNSLYDQLAYKEAAERFQAAETLFARAAAVQAPPPKRSTPPSF